MRHFKNLIGAGLYLLLTGLLLEGLALIIHQWVRFPISLDIGVQILLTILCIVTCLLGIIWFNRSLDLIRVNFSDEKKRLITHGPFAYVRHPLYATLEITMPPLLIVWLNDLLFMIPWILIISISHFLVRIEERQLIDVYGEDYKKYQTCVPALLPYKGAGGKRFSS